MSINLNEAFEAGCNEAVNAAYGQLSDAWGEKTAAEWLNKATKSVGDFYSPTAIRKKNYKNLTDNREKYDKIHNKGLASGGSGNEAIDKHLTRRTVLEAGAKYTGTAAGVGAAGYGGYRGYGAMSGDKKKAR